jgi:hypothetical protein
MLTSFSRVQSSTGDCIFLDNVFVLRRLNKALIERFANNRGKSYLLADEDPNCQKIVCKESFGKVRSGAVVVSEARLSALSPEQTETVRGNSEISKGKKKQSSSRGQCPHHCYHYSNDKLDI